MATEYVIYFFLIYTRFFAFIRNYTPIFGKYFHGKVALEAIKQDKTIAQLSSKYGVHFNQISRWKKHLLNELPGIFTGRKKAQEKKKAEEFLNRTLSTNRPAKS